MHHGVTMPSSFVRRPPVPSDAGAVAELVIAYEPSLYGATTYSLGDLEAEWEVLDLARDALVLLDGEQPVAFGSVHDRGELWRIDGYVHPEQRGRGIGTELARPGRVRRGPRRRGIPRGAAGGVRRSLGVHA